MRALKTGGALLVALGLLFVLLTVAALEGPEVVVLRTMDAHGKTRETRTWIADYDGLSWVEAANPAREFYRQILENPEVELLRGKERQRFRAVPLANPEGHVLIRRLLFEKYGLADRWIGLLADTSQSIAIRLDPR